MPGSQDNELKGLRTLPHDETAEKSILGALLLSSECWDRVEMLVSPSDFYSPTNRVIFEAISALVNDEGKSSFDSLILLEYLRRKNLLEKAGGAGYIAKLTAQPFIVANVTEYCEIVKEASRRRLLFHVSSSLMESVFDPSVNIRRNSKTEAKRSTTPSSAVLITPHPSTNSEISFSIHSAPSSTK